MATTYVDFSGRDYTTILERLQAKLIQELPELTDLNYSDAGQFLLRRLASESDYLHWYLDEAFFENFIDTAEQRQSLINIAKLVGWKIRMYSSSSCTLRLTRISGVTGDITIPEYQVFQRPDGLLFYAAPNSGDDYILLDGQTYLDISIIQGQRFTYNIQEHEFEEHDFTGLLRYGLGPQVSEGTVSVVSGDDLIEWEYLESFYRSTDTDACYTIDYESDPEDSTNDNCYLVLGPIGFPTGDTITCSFTKSNGSLGNTGVGTITEIDGLLANSVTCSNITTATGGSDIETVSSFKERIPSAVRTQRRGVIIEDYESLVTAVPGVRFCQVVDRNTDETMPHLYVKVYVVPFGGLTISDELRNSIGDQLAGTGALGSWIGRYIILEATPYIVNISARIGTLSGHNSATVANNLSAKLSEYLQSDIFGIGDELDFSDLNIFAGRQTGISWVEFDSPDEDIVINQGQIITPGTITITVQN